MGDTSPQLSTAVELSPPTASRDTNVYLTGTLFPNVTDLHTRGGSFTSVGGDMHIHAHYHSNPDVAGGPSKSTSHHSEAPNVDVMAILQTVSNYRKIQQDTFSKATPKTGEWMLKHEKIAVWQDPTSGLDMMCGSGIPGAGKTVLSYACFPPLRKDGNADPVAARSIMINHAEERARELGSSLCIGFIYLRYSDNASLTVRRCLEVLVKQSLQQYSSLLCLAEEVYAPHVRLEGEPPEGELLRLLQRFTRAVTSTTYFLDALDEAPPEIQIDLVEKLLSTGAKLFITSRPFTVLEERFPNGYHFPIAAQTSDLDLHINSQLDRGQELRRVLEQGGASLRADIVDSIKEKCGGMFLHASLQLAALQNCASVHDVRETLATFPPKIDDVYRQTWMRIVGHASESNSLLAPKCLTLVLNAPKSMTVAELQHAAAVCLDTHKFDPDRIVPIDSIVSLCCGLLVGDEETELVRLVHYTAKEPLERLVLETFPHLHSLMAMLCIARLIHHGFQDWKNDDPESVIHVMEADPLLPYAYHAWSQHGQNSLSDPSMVTKVKEFVRGCRSFPLDWGYYKPELLGPLHVVALFNLPISMAGSRLINSLNPNCRTQQKFTPLHLACWHPHSFGTLQELLSLRFIDVNAVNRQKKTPLFYAVQFRNEGAVKNLLAHPKIRLDLTDEDGLTVFTTAAREGNEAVVKLILTHSPGEIHSTDGKGRTALSWACEGGHFTMVKLLLSHSQSEIHSTNGMGRTALSLACEGGHFTMVKLLLSHSQSEVHLAGDNGRTPLSWAASSRCIETFKHILSLAQDDIHLADKDGCTPLSWASLDGHKEAVKILLAYPGTDINQVDDVGRTPLSWAAKYNREGVVKVLLANPLTIVNLADTGGWTPLICASTTLHYRADSARALLGHPQINVNLQDKQGHTALIWAIRYFNLEQVKLLLAHPDIKVNLPDREGQTPLIWTAINKYESLQDDEEEIIQALLVHSVEQGSRQPAGSAGTGLQGSGTGQDSQTLDQPATFSTGTAIAGRAKMPASYCQNVDKTVKTCSLGVYIDTFESSEP